MTPAGTDVLPRASDALLNLECLVVKQGGFTLTMSNLLLMPGTRLGVVGRNGSGKTTLLEALIGLRKSTQMHGHLFGVGLPSAVHRPDLRRRMGCQLQSTRFSRHTTVAELVELHLSLYGRGNAPLMGALRIRELSSLRGGLLSRGQRQRLELYMALAHGPEILVLDEPLTGLDRHFSDVVMNFIHDDLPPSCALIVVGHSEEEHSLINEVAWLQDGGVLDRGTSADLIARHAGSILLRLGFHCREQLVQMHALLSHTGCLPRWHDQTGLQLTLCGDEGMVAQVMAVCPPQHLRTWEQTCTNVTDLVRLGRDVTAISDQMELAPCVL